MSLKVDHLTKTFGEKVAVDNISFEMTEPGVFGLIGTNGAGKTTTIRMILGIMGADSGSAVWNGKPITRETLAFGYMPEERGIYMKNKVLEQLVYFGMLRGTNRTDAKKSALRLMERLGVSEYKDMLAEKLSKGNQQKIQLMAALISEPEFLILDEPLSGLDPVNTDLFKGIIREEIAKNKYLIMSSHQMPTIEEFCTDITIMNRGQAVLQGNLNAIKKGYGRVNLFVKSDSEIAPYIQKFGIQIVAKMPSEYHLKVTDERQAREFLASMMQDNVPLVKFELREPSLHEIFVEKVGDDNEER